MDADFMLSISSDTFRCCDGVSRRQLLQIGVPALGLAAIYAAFRSVHRWLAAILICAAIGAADLTSVRLLKPLAARPRPVDANHPRYWPFRLLTIFIDGKMCCSILVACSKLQPSVFYGENTDDRHPAASIGCRFTHTA